MVILMDQIQYVGLQDLEEVDQEMVKKLCAEYYDKVKRMLKNEVDVKVHIKSQANEGHRHRYEVSISANAPTMKFDASKHSQQAQWDLASVIHEGFKSLMKEIEHRFKE